MLRNLRQKVLTHLDFNGILGERIFSQGKLTLSMSQRYCIFLVVFILGCFLFKACHAEGLAYLGLERHATTHFAIHHEHGRHVCNRICKNTPMAADLPDPAIVSVPHLDKPGTIPVDPHIFFLPLLILRI